MASPVEKLKHRLASAGYSFTGVRRQIFLCLADKEPQTIHELVEQLPTINRSSIYRTVDLFVELGIIERLQMSWKYKLELTDQYGQHHHHMTCTSCGRIIVCDAEALETEITLLAARANFRPTGHQLEIRGTCNQCEYDKKRSQ